MTSATAETFASDFITQSSRAAFWAGNTTRCVVFAPCKGSEKADTKYLYQHTIISIVLSVFQLLLSPQTATLHLPPYIVSILLFAIYINILLFQWFLTWNPWAPGSPQNDLLGLTDQQQNINITAHEIL